MHRLRHLPGGRPAAVHVAFRYACWYSWPVLADSLERLAAHHRFASVLPGHGARTEGDPDELHARLVALVARMRA